MKFSVDCHYRLADGDSGAANSRTFVEGKVMLRERSAGQSAFLTLVETVNGERKNKLFTIVCLGHLQEVAIAERAPDVVVAAPGSPRRASLRRTKFAAAAAGAGGTGADAGGGGASSNVDPVAVTPDAQSVFLNLRLEPGDGSGAEPPTVGGTGQPTALSLCFASADVAVSWIKALLKYSDAAPRSIARAAFDVAELVVADEEAANRRMPIILAVSKSKKIPRFTPHTLSDTPTFGGTVVPLNDTLDSLEERVRDLLQPQAEPAEDRDEIVALSIEDYPELARNVIHTHNQFPKLHAALADGIVANVDSLSATPTQVNFLKRACKAVRGDEVPPPTPQELQERERRPASKAVVGGGEEPPRVLTTGGSASHSETDTDEDLAPIPMLALGVVADMGFSPAASQKSKRKSILDADVLINHESLDGFHTSLDGSLSDEFDSTISVDDAFHHADGWQRDAETQTEEDPSIVSLDVHNTVLAELDEARAAQAEFAETADKAHAEIASKDLELSAKEAEVGEQAAAIMAKDVQLAANDEAIAARDAEIASLDAELAARDAEIESKGTALEAKEGENAKLRDELDASRTVIETLRGRVAELEKVRENTKSLQRWVGDCLVERVGACYHIPLRAVTELSSVVALCVVRPTRFNLSARWRRPCSPHNCSIYLWSTQPL